MKSSSVNLNFTSGLLFSLLLCVVFFFAMKEVRRFTETIPTLTDRGEWEITILCKVAWEKMLLIVCTLIERRHHRRANFFELPTATLVVVCYRICKWRLFNVWLSCRVLMSTIFPIHPYQTPCAAQHSQLSLTHTVRISENSLKKSFHLTLRARIPMKFSTKPRVEREVNLLMKF